MKKTFTLLLLCVVTLGFTQNVIFNDTNLANALLENTDINKDSNTVISIIEAEAVTGTLNLDNLGIADATGLEAFTKITELQINHNDLTILDISSNQELVTLSCNNNKLKTLTIRNASAINTSLKNLYANYNDFESLTTVLASTAPNTEVIEISNCPNLVTVFCATLEHLKRLTANNCGSLTNIIKYQNPNLEELIVNNSGLYNLDVSNLTSLKTLDCSNNRLVYLNLQNGTNPDITTIDLTGNSDLECILVDDVATANRDWNSSKDATSTFSNTTCVEYIEVPDTNFKAKLIANSDLNTDNDSEISRIEARLFTGALNIPNSSISDLTGLEEFINLTILNCQNNNLSTIDISKNVDLVYFYGTDNNYVTINAANGNNAHMDRFEADSYNSNYGNFQCIKIDLGFNPSNWNVDHSASYTTSDCGVVLFTNATNGTITPDTLPTKTEEYNLNGTYTIGTEVELTATPDPGYEFNSWSGAVTSTANPITLTMNEYKTVTAIFIPALATNQVFDQKTSIYPNPTTDNLNIDLPAGEMLKSVSVFTLLGEMVKETNTTSIDFSTMTEGAYILKIENTEGKIAIRKIIKEKR